MWQVLFGASLGDGATGERKHPGEELRIRIELEVLTAKLTICYLYW